jgi:hypothetical protein
MFYFNILLILIFEDIRMGSFRSQPDLVKHTTVKSGIGFTYASTHMCGTFWDI